jgi:ferredoxin
MDAGEMRAFIESPYNRVSDVKMYLFFARIGGVAAAVLGALAVVSIFVQGAWCRYLCPYGVLLGFFSRWSPVRIARSDGACTGCGVCDRVCMARLPVSRRAETLSVECTGCLDCVASCPVEPALAVAGRRRRVPVLGFALAVVLFFLAGYAAARATGIWRNAIPEGEYVERIRSIDSPAYSHPGARGR